MTYGANALKCFLVAAILVGSTARLQAEPKSQSTFKAPAKKAEKPSITNHMRIRRNMEDDAPIALQTSIARYVPESGEGELVVDLIGVVHIGDPAYYQYLNRHFEQYDVLLYELVAPPEKAVPNPDENSDNPLRWIQKISQSVLDLKHQLDIVDYTQENFVHADMSPKQMAKAIDERGDNGVTLALSVAADLLRQQNLKARELEKNPDKFKSVQDFDPFDALFDDYGTTKFKRLLAEQFANLNGAGSGLGNTLDTILIKDRNSEAMRIFQTQLAKGHKRIGIFYGAAHMPDFEERLVRDFELKRVDVQWVTAWDLRMKRKSPVEGVLTSVLEELVKQALKKN